MFTSQVHESLSSAQSVCGVARVVGEVLLLNLPDDEGVLAAPALHVPLPIGVKPHGLAVPDDVSLRVSVHDVGQLGWEAKTTEDNGTLSCNFRFIWKRNFLALK